MLRIQVACADRDQLGEGPLWDVDEQRLYWMDSYGPAIRGMEPNGAKRRSQSAPWSFAAAAAGSWRSAADSLRLILVSARPSASVKASQANCGPSQRRQGQSAGSGRRRVNGFRKKRAGRQIVPARSRPFDSYTGWGNHLLQRIVLEPGRTHPLLRRHRSPRDLRLRLRSDDREGAFAAPVCEL